MAATTTRLLATTSGFAQTAAMNVSATTGNASVVAVTPTAGAYGNLTNYMILTAAGGVTGAFAGVTSTDVTLSPSWRMAAMP